MQFLPMPNLSVCVRWHSSNDRLGKRQVAMRRGLERGTKWNSAVSDSEKETQHEDQQ